MKSDARSGPSAPVVVFAGGGSGGHISPGLAIAERLSEIDDRAKSMFLCSNRPLDASMLTRAEADFVALPAVPPSRRLRAGLGFGVSFLKSWRLARREMKSRGVTHVVALGGFVSAPVVMAARSCRLPVLMVNLDRPPGRANRWIASRCDRVVTAIELPDQPGFAEQVVGMPIRKAAIAPPDAAECRVRLGLDPARPTLLVTGASQGSHSINEFVVGLAERHPASFAPWQVFHLAGVSESESLAREYERLEIPAMVESFRHDIGLAWGAATLAISRAGASSVAEAARNGVPTLFLPYPYHQDQHQRHNAAPMESIGGALIVTDHVDRGRNLAEIGPTLCRLLEDETVLQTMRDSLAPLAGVDAAGKIARMLLAGG